MTEGQFYNYCRFVLKHYDAVGELDETHDRGLIVSKGATDSTSELAANAKWRLFYRDERPVMHQNVTPEGHSFLSVPSYDDYADGFPRAITTFEERTKLRALEAMGMEVFYSCSWQDVIDEGKTRARSAHTLSKDR